MKYLKKKKKSKLVPVLIVLVVAIVALIGAMLLLMSVNGGGDKTPSAQQPASQTQAAQSTQAPAEKELGYADGVLQTPYGDFPFPVEDEDCLNIRVSEGEPYIVSFSASLPGREEVALLDLYFGRGGEHSLGLLQTGDGTSVELGMTLHYTEFAEGWTQEEMDRVHAMQEAANEMLSGLELLPVPADTEPSEELAIETPYCTLTFPGKWEKYLQVVQEEGEPYRVNFFAKVGSHERQALFSLCFGAEENALGTVDGVPVGILMEELIPDDSWTDEEKNILFAMQEDMNLLLEALPLD